MLCNQSNAGSQQARAGGVREQDGNGGPGTSSDFLSLWHHLQVQGSASALERGRK